MSTEGENTDFFYFVIACIFVSELFVEKGIVKVLCRCVGARVQVGMIQNFPSKSINRTCEETITSAILKRERKK